MPELSVLVDGGKASAGAPLGPALGPMGVNIVQVVNKINEKTKSFAGMKVPVKILVDAATKTFEIEVGSPPTSALITKEAGADKGAANPKTEQKGNLSLAQIHKIAEMKMEKLGSYKMKSAMCEVIGTCDSMGVFVEGKRAKEFLKEVRAGKHDDAFRAFE